MAPRRTPIVVQWAATTALRRWRSLAFLGLCAVISIVALRGARHSEWREVAYYRSDPFPLLPEGSDPTFTAPPPSADNTSGVCRGPGGQFIHKSPLVAYATPDSHPHPILGDPAAVGINMSQCLTYRSRYSMYTDEALGIVYRRAKVDPALLAARDHAVAQADKGADVVLKDKAAKAFASGPGYTLPSKDALDVDYVDPLMGRRRPEGITDEAWDTILRNDLKRANDAAELLGASTYPDWRKLLHSCALSRQEGRNMDVFWPDDADPLLLGGAGAHRADPTNLNPKFRTTPETKRTAIVLRLQEGHVWHEDDVLNVRALIAELGLNNPNTPYDVRLLVEVRNSTLAPFTSEWDRLHVLRTSVPHEFWGLVELWTETALCALYPGLWGEFRSGLIAQSSSRACLMPLQKFFLDHPEYDYIWNWEITARVVGNYLDFFEGVEAFGRKEALHVGMDRYKGWLVRNVTESEDNWAQDPKLQSGRNEEADLLTLAPIFDPIDSGWAEEYDVQNYLNGRATPRRASIGTNLRLSRSLLDAMNVVTAEAKKHMHCEAWAASLTLHSQLPIGHGHSFYPEAGFTHMLPLPFKGVFAPHPVYFRHIWDPPVLQSKINGGKLFPGASQLMRDSSYWSDGAHARELYQGWRASAAQSGPEVCRAPVLLHPVQLVD